VALLPPVEWVRNIDFLSTVQFFRATQRPLVFIFWGALSLAAIYILTTIKRPDITLVALLFGTGYWGFFRIRFLPFFMVAALPAIGLLFSAGRVRTWTRHLLLASSVALVAYLSRNEMPTRERISLALRVNDNIYPVQAADFVLANDLKGNLYNTYFWGGYLLWRLGPERKVFIDGRVMNSQAAFESSSINMAFARPGEVEPYWNNLLKRNGVGYVVIPRIRRRPGILFEDTGRLIKALLDHPEWVPVYIDGIASVFVLRTPENHDVIARHGLPKDRPLGWWLR
jgi:hypothetical protein